MRSLLEVESFGGIDAEADILLDECFQDHEAYLDAVSHKRPLVLGRKGSGKTAIFRKIIRTRKSSVFAFGHTFSDYPWQHHKLQESIGVPEELRYVQSWLYLILLTAAKILLNQDSSQPWNERAFEELERLERFVIDSYGSRDPDVTELFTPTKRLRIRPHLRIAKEWLDLGLDLEELPVNELPRIIQEVNKNISAAIIESLNPEHDYFICFDELDRGFDPRNKSYAHMLTGLILAAKVLNGLARNGEKKFSVVIFLRDDIYHTLRFEDKNKITENFATRIEWDSPRTRWTLRELMERRFTKVIGNGAVRWRDVFDETQEMPGRQKKYQHILDRTFCRPRDIIKFCNVILEAYKSRRPAQTKFANDDLNNARPSYSEYLLRELDDEIHKHIQHYEDYVSLLKKIGAGLFSREDFELAFRESTSLFTPGITPVEILRQLFEFSIVAYQRTGGVGGGSEYIWRYLDSRARFDEGSVYFRVHPGFIEALGLKRYTIKKRGGQS
jgi:hypothetical protein